MKHLILALILFLPITAYAADRPPNVVIIFLDDSGWSDFQPFGDPGYPTPNVKRLADEGLRFNRFYVPQAICSASRAALMTGAILDVRRYSVRTGRTNAVSIPNSTRWAQC